LLKDVWEGEWWGEGIGGPGMGVLEELMDGSFVGMGRFRGASAGGV